MAMVRVGVAAVALLTGSVGATPEATRVSQAASQSVIGHLVSYDHETRSLTVATGSGRQTFVLAGKASVRRGSRVLEAKELALHAGAKVKVRYFNNGSGRLVAETVMVSSAR
jgi:phage baseplate assembly protein gpV